MAGRVQSETFKSSVLLDIFYAEHAVSLSTHASLSSGSCYLHPQGSGRHFCPSPDTSCSGDLYAYTSTSLPLCVFLSHSLIPPHSSCSLSISFWRVAAHAHTCAHTHVGGRTRRHAKEVAPSHGECRRAVSNPVPGRVGLLGD